MPIFSRLFTPSLLLITLSALTACGNGVSDTGGASSGTGGSTSSATGSTSSGTGGSTSSGTGTYVPPHVDGTIGGQSFAAADAISGIGTLDGDPGVADGSTVGFILIGDQPQLCQTVTATQNFGNNTQILMIYLADVDAATKTYRAPTQPETLQIVSQTSIPTGNHAALVSYLETDADGNEVSARDFQATSGTVTLTSVTAEHAFAATGDVTLDNGDHLTFQFDAAPCAALTMTAM